MCKVSTVCYRRVTFTFWSFNTEPFVNKEHFTSYENAPCDIISSHLNVFGRRLVDSWHHKIIYKINLVITSRLNSEYIIMFRLKHWKQFIVSSIHNSHRTSYKRAFYSLISLLRAFLALLILFWIESPWRHLSYEEVSQHSLTRWIYFFPPYQHQNTCEFDLIIT